MDPLLENQGDLADWKRDLLASVRWHLSRRDFVRALAIGAAALLGPSLLRSARGQPASAPAGVGKPAKKAVKTGTFYFPRLMFHVKDETGDQWNTDPVGDANLRRRLKELTNINVSQDPVVVRLADLDHLCRYPFVFATSEGYFRLPDKEENNLKEFLMRGGFVLADDCVYNQTGDRFFRDYRKMMRRIFPEHRIERVPATHELYHCYFEFPKGALYLQGTKSHGGDWAVFEKGTGRIMSLITPWDYHCGWVNRFFTARLNDLSMRMGVNIVIYYLTH